MLQFFVLIGCLFSVCYDCILLFLVVLFSVFFVLCFFFFFSSRRRHTRYIGDWSQTCALPISERPDGRRGGRDRAACPAIATASPTVWSLSGRPGRKERSVSAATVSAGVATGTTAPVHPFA